MARIWKIINKYFIRFVLSLLQWTSWSDKRRYEQKRKTASSAFKTKWRKRYFQADDHVTFTSSSKRENVAKGISSSRTISWISIRIGDTQVSWFHSTRQHLTPPALVWGGKKSTDSNITFIDGDQNKTLLPKVPLEWHRNANYYWCPYPTTSAARKVHDRSPKMVQLVHTQTSEDRNEQSIVLC